MKTATIESVRRNNLYLLANKYGGWSILAARIGKPPTQVSQWKNAEINQGTGKARHISSRSCRGIEQTLGLPDGWMDVPHDDNDSGNSNEPTSHGDLDTSPRSVAGLLVPLLSWEQAGEWEQELHRFKMGCDYECVACPQEHSENTFALKVNSSVMEPLFAANDVIFVDASIDPVDGKSVVIRLSPGEDATLRRIHVDGNRRFVTILNQDWPGEKSAEVGADAKICGVVVGTYREV